MKRSFIGTPRQKRKIDARSIPTWKLKEIVENDGMTSIGTDYGPLLPELRQELHKRYHKENVRDMKRAHFERMRSEQAAPTHIVCTNCQATAKTEEAAALFYADPRKIRRKQPNIYRPLCKTCMKQLAKERHDNKSITTPF